MKNLANCTPTEFMKQTVKLRGVIKNWAENSGFAEIRKRKPEGYENMTGKEKTEAMNAQAMENISDMLYAAIEKDPEGTLKVMALCCFVEPEDVDSHPISEYLKGIMEMFNNEVVRSFFLLLLQSKNSRSSEA